MNFLRLALIGFIIPLFASANELKLEPLRKYVDEITKNGNSDVSQLAYVGTRCAALFTALSGYVNENPRDDKDRELAEKLLARALPYFQVSMFLNMTANKMSQDAADTQMKLLIGRYSALMGESKQLNNEIMSPFVLAEMDAANYVRPLFEKAAAEINAELKNAEALESKQQTKAK